jgi:hypothetical protein
MTRFAQKACRLFAVWDAKPFLISVFNQAKFSYQHSETMVTGISLLAKRGADTDAMTIRRARKRDKPRFRRASYEQEQAKRKERAHGAWVGIVRAKMKIREV